MKIAVILTSAVAGIAALASNALADCSLRGGYFYPAQNDSVTYSGVVTGNGSCNKTFTTKGLMFTSVDIVSRPAQGSLTTSGVATFQYIAKPGYKGADKFAVKACATGKAGSGCSTLTYDLMVQ